MHSNSGAHCQLCGCINHVILNLRSPAPKVIAVRRWDKYLPETTVLNEKFQLDMKQCECLKCPLQTSMKIWAELQITLMTPPSNVCPRQWWTMNSFCNTSLYSKMAYSSFTLKVLKHLSYFFSPISWVSITASLYLQNWTHMEKHYIKSVHWCNHKVRWARLNHPTFCTYMHMYTQGMYDQCTKNIALTYV
jgi:hypothetical protein